MEVRSKPTPLILTQAGEANLVMDDKTNQIIRLSLLIKYFIKTKSRQGQ
jgi:hypothetical protein